MRDHDVLISHKEEYEDYVEPDQHQENIEYDEPEQYQGGGNQK